MKYKLSLSQAKFQKYIEDSKRILIISSQPLDPDCIASGLIMKKYLEYLGKKTTLLFPRKLRQEEIETFLYLPYFNEIIGDDSRNYSDKDYDTLLFLDGASWIQFYDYQNKLPGPEFEKYKKIIHIDHHPNPEVIATYTFRDKGASSTVEILLRDIVPFAYLDKKTATLAYAAFVEDTGNFKYNFNPRTLKFASKLLEKGAAAIEIVERVYNSNSKEYFEMLSYAIENTEYDKDLETQFLFLPLSKQKQDDISDEKMGILKMAYQIELSRRVAGYPLAIIMYEKKEIGDIRISGRGSNFYNKINLPKLFTKIGGNGGGHFNAAGTDCEGNFEEEKKKLKSTIAEILRKY
jgi:phosphoesterase RecJ-like protein